ncbi:MAG: AAA family ATPase [Nitrospirota bacterium]
MFLVELVLQGIRGFRELSRLRFQSGFNLIVGGNESGKTTAIEAIHHMLFPRDNAGREKAFVSRKAPENSRAALLMLSDDRSYYRIIEDFSKHAVNVSQYNAKTKEFTLLHKDWDNAGHFMSGLTTGLSEEDFSRIFVLRKDHYTDHSENRESARLVPTPAIRQEKKKTAVNQERLAELREMLRKAEEAADAEYRAQSAKLALDDFRKKMTSIDETEKKKNEITSTLKELSACATLPENLSDLVETYERVQGQISMEREELHKQLGALKIQLGDIPAINLLTDKFFVAGASLLVLSIIVGGFMLTAEQAHFFPIGILFSLGLMTVAWYNSSRKNTQRKVIAAEKESIERELQEVEKRFEQESTTVQSYIKATGSSDVKQLKDKADTYRYFISLQEDLAEQHQRMLSGKTPEMLQEEYNQLQQEALELSKAAQAVAHDNIDTYSVRQDMERIEAEGQARSAPWDFGGEEINDLPTEVVIPVEETRQGGFRTELTIASRVGEIELETLAPAVVAAAQRNLSAVTNGKYIRIELGRDGKPLLVHTSDNVPLNRDDLSHGIRDLVYFCLRTGLVEALAGKRRMPFLLDDSLSGFDAAHQKAASQVLRTLGTKTQVVLFSSNPALKTDGDSFLELSRP